MKAVRAILAVIFSLLVLFPIFVVSSAINLLIGALTSNMGMAFDVIGYQADMIRIDIKSFVLTGKRCFPDA